MSRHRREFKIQTSVNGVIKTFRISAMDLSEAEAVVLQKQPKATIVRDLEPAESPTAKADDARTVSWIDETVEEFMNKADNTLIVVLMLHLGIGIWLGIKMAVIPGLTMVEHGNEGAGIWHLLIISLVCLLSSIASYGVFSFLMRFMKTTVRLLAARAA